MAKNKMSFMLRWKIRRDNKKISKEIKKALNPGEGNELNNEELVSKPLLKIVVNNTKYNTKERK